MGSKVRNLISAAAPLAGLIPGIGLPAAIALGAGGGLIGGGGLRGALTGGLGAAALGGGGPILGSALGAGTGTAASALGTGLLGAGAGAASGGLKGALLGGVAGGLGGYANAGGFDGLGQSLGLTGENGLLGSSASNWNVQGPTASGATLAQPGSGLLGAATRGLSDIGSALGVGTGGGGSTYSSGSGGSSYSGLGALLGGANSLNANDQAQKDLLAAQNDALSKLNPYLKSGEAANSRLSDLLGTSGNSSVQGYGSLSDTFNPGDLTQDPGYQFQLEEGNKALDRQAAAKGGYYSGAALKDAQSFGQGLADQTYKDAFARDLTNKQNIYGMFSGQSGSGQSAANNAADLYQGIGNAKANAGISSANITNQSLSSLLSGSGARRVIGYQNGLPIYA